jgi:hypothetical protein
MGLTLLLAIAITGAAAAQDGDPTPCEAAVSGTVVAVDEDGVVTIDTGGDLCTVMLDGTWDHPIVALLGSYFDDASAEALSEALDALQIEYICTDDTGDETCSLVGEGEGDPAEVVSVTYDDENDVYIVVLKINGDIETKTFTDQEQAEAWIDALDALNVDWTLKTDDEDNTFVSEVGDDIAAYHEDGWGFGQLVKAYAVGKPSILGVGHVRHADKDKGTPPPDACGYWKKHQGDEPLEDGDADGSMTEDPCADFINKIKDKDKDKGKPPWAGGPGGKPKDEK